MARQFPISIFATLVLLLQLSSAPSAQAGEELRQEVYVTFAASAMEELTFSTGTPGFAIGYEIIPWYHLLVGAAAGYQAPVRVDNLGLIYDISLAEGMIYVGARFPLDPTGGPLFGGDETSTAFRFVGANEFSMGATLGLSRYVQKVLQEQTRIATHPFAGIYMSWNIWLLDWLGLHFSALFHWNLTEVIPGTSGFLRKEVQMGPTFRF